MKLRWLSALAFTLALVVTGAFLMPVPQADALQECGECDRVRFDPVLVSCGGSPVDCLACRACG